MNTRHFGILGIAAIAGLLVLPPAALAQDKDEDKAKADKAKKEYAQEVQNEVSIGVYYLDDPSYRFGKYNGLTEDGAEALIDFRIEKRPAWDGTDLTRWRFQGWRVGLESRRIEFDFNQQGTQKFNFDYREIPNNRFADGQTPYLGAGSAELTLPSTWAIAPGSSDTRGFLTLNESLGGLRMDVKRRRMDLSYERKLTQSWGFNVDYRHETKKGERMIGGIFGSSGGNPRAVILPAPVDYTTDIVEATFEFTTPRVQAGFGVYASWFSNDELGLVWQNAFGRQAQWDESVTYPTAYGRLALEPDNSYLQFRAFGAMNLTATTRLSADVSFGEMEQDDDLLPYTINPNLIVHTPVPLQSLDAQMDMMLVNVRLTSQLARRLSFAANYRYDDRDNKTPREVYPYIGGDSQDQRPYEDGRINLPYSYSEQSADATATFRLMGNTRLKAGVDWSDYEREYSEVSDADEFAWVGGINIGAFETAAISFDYRDSERDVDAYIGNTPLLESHLPGTVEETEFENHPLLRKYFLTDRDRSELRFRMDYFPVTEINVGLSASRFEDDYGEGYFGLNEAEVQSYSVDFGWYPQETISVTGYYTREKYDADQSNRSWSDAATAANPLRDWYAETSDDVDTWNLSVDFTEIGADRGWHGFDFGFDYTRSNTESQIDVTSPSLAVAPLPELRTDMTSISAWASIAVGRQSSIRLAIENNQLETDDFALDNIEPGTLANVLLLGEDAANYDIILVTGSFTYRF